MSFLDLVKERRSIRNYDPDKQIPGDILEHILEAGQAAPSAKNLQPWTFIVVRSPEMRLKLNECYQREWFKNAPVILLVKGDKNQSWVRSDGYNSIETDLTIAMDHMILAAEANYLATCWIAAFDNQKLRRVLSLKDNEVVYAMTPLGYPQDDFIKPTSLNRKPLSEVVEYL